MGQPVKRPRRRAAPLQKNGRVNLLLDIQSRLQGHGPGYERWLKIHNLKEAAKTLNYLTEHNITDYELLAATAASVSENFEKTATAIKQYEHRMEQIADLKKAHHQLCENTRHLCGLPESQPQGKGTIPVSP